MEFSIASHQARTYTVATPVYEGPLDLLLQLIERAELDITRLALAQVTDQYLEHLRRIENQAADEVSAFLVIAAKLLQIKSEALLPRPPAREEGEDDPGEELARQLLAYKQFKEAGTRLYQREAANLRNYLRLAPAPKIERRVEPNGLVLADLVEAGLSVFAKAEQKTPLRTIVSAPLITIREKIAHITRLIQRKGRTTFWSLVSNRRSHLDIVVTFLAMLELIKRNLVEVHQEGLFSEIELETAGTWDENDDFELEFGE